MSEAPVATPTITSNHEGRKRRSFGAVSKVMLTIAAVAIVALVVFVLQNTVHTTISFIAWDFDLGVGVALLGSAVIGAVIALAVSAALRTRRALS